MAIAIEFIRTGESSIAEAAGLVTARPALEQDGRIYVIENPATARPVYVGTAESVRHRFEARIAALREFGFAAAVLSQITIRAYRVEVNGISRRPNTLGYAGGVDVEHLMIRLHLTMGVNVRNMNKVVPYRNFTGQELHLEMNAPVPAYLGAFGIHVVIGNGVIY